MRHVTIKEIAEKTGYSMNTVSRALANRGEISKETTKKIREEAEKIGYIPNLLALGLAGRRSNTIGLIMGETQNPFHWPVVKAVQEELTGRGLNLVLANSEETAAGLRTAVNLLLSSRVDGLLMFFPDGGEESLRLLQARGVPTVLMGTKSDAVPTSYVECDDIRGGYLATSHLFQRGCRRVAYIGKWQGTFPSEIRLEGFCRALLEAGQKPDGRLVFHAAPTLEGGYTSAAGIDFLGLEIDGIVAHNDLIAMGTLRNLAQRGINVPNQVAVVGFDNIPFGEYCLPPLTTVDIPKDTMGRKAVEMLLGLIEAKLAEKPVQLQSMLLNPMLVIRHSA